MKTEDYLWLGVIGLALYGAYRVYKGVSSWNPIGSIENSLSSAFSSLKGTLSGAIDAITPDIRPEPQPEIYAFSNLSGMITDALSRTGERYKTLTTAPQYSGAGMGGDQTIFSSKQDTGGLISQYPSWGVDTGVFFNPYKDATPIKKGDIGWINPATWGY